MDTNAILDDAEARITEATVQTQATQAEIVEAMREAIGRQHYEQANEQLPNIEHAIRTEFHPFIDRVATIANKAKAPLPPSVRRWLQEMATLCEQVPTTIRAGLTGWDQLTPPIWTDGQSVDLTARATLVYGIRSSLRNWDGVQGYLKNLKAQVEQYIQASGWPASQPGATTITPAPPRAATEMTEA